MAKPPNQVYELESKPGKPIISPVGGQYFVAPDGESGDAAFHDHWNTLVIPGEYKLQVRLGKFDDLFPTAVDDSTDLFPNTVVSKSPSVKGSGGFTGRKA